MAVGGGLGRSGPGLLGLGTEQSDGGVSLLKDAQGLFKLGPEEADISAEMLFVEWTPASSAHISAEMLFVEWDHTIDAGAGGSRILLGVGK